MTPLHLCRTMTCALAIAATALVSGAEDTGGITDASKPEPRKEAPAEKPATEAASNESSQYRLTNRDSVKVIVQGEPDVSVERRIDGNGNINIPLIGMVKAAGETINGLQDLIKSKYVEAEIFVHPEIVISVTDYSPREVTVMGCVSKIGKVAFPPESTSMTIVDAIASAGGLTRLANPSSVRLKRTDEDGKETTITLDVGKMLSEVGSKTTSFKVQPGDVIYVPERLF